MMVKYKEIYHFQIEPKNQFEYAGETYPLDIIYRKKYKPLKEFDFYDVCVKYDDLKKIFAEGSEFLTYINKIEIIIKEKIDNDVLYMPHNYVVIQYLYPNWYTKNRYIYFAFIEWLYNVVLKIPFDIKLFKINTVLQFSNRSHKFTFNIEDTDKVHESEKWDILN